MACRLCEMGEPAATDDQYVCIDFAASERLRGERETGAMLPSEETKGVIDQRFANKSSDLAVRRLRSAKSCMDGCPRERSSQLDKYPFCSPAFHEEVVSDGHAKLRSARRGPRCSRLCTVVRNHAEISCERHRTEYASERIRTARLSGSLRHGADFEWSSTISTL